MTTAPVSTTNNSQVWDLDSIFSGGSQSAEMNAYIAALESELPEAAEADLPDTLSAETRADWIATISRAHDLSMRLHQVASFVSCLVAQDVNDEPAIQVQAKTDQLWALVSKMHTRLASAMAEQSDDEWEALLQTPELQPVAFGVNEQRERAREQMAPAFEVLAGDLAVDGYHAWGRLYGKVSGLKQFDFDGKPQSLYQLQNIFTANEDRDTRRRAFETFETGWSELAPICAMALNYQAGYRQTLYRHRNWDSVLHEPLRNNRITRQTLDAMWDTIGRMSDKLLDYFEVKQRLLGIDKLTWYDVHAPLSAVIDAQELSYTYPEACQFVVDSVGKVDPAVAEFCQMAIEKRWVESENRSNHRAGGFCTSLPVSGETRVFMSFSGTYDSLATLAHELGHSYHGWALRDMPYAARHYTMGVAETASTMNELVVLDASLNAATDDGIRLSLLNEKLSNAITFLMNIRARYLFETSFFDARTKGHLSVDELSELMVAAQQKAYHNSLAGDGYHGLFWASKMHFYITKAPFYNFPYTFGYLFSYGVYDRAIQDGPAFSQKYRDLLRDTGSMQTEALAKKHLGVDLSQPEFWESAVSRALADVDTFIELANKVAGNGNG